VLWEKSIHCWHNNINGGQLLLLEERGDGKKDINITTPKVGPLKCTIDPKLPSSLCVHFQNQLCTYAEEIVKESNFIP